MSTCPEGHTSQSEDYCDVCGSPIDNSAGSAPATPTAPSSSTPAPSEPKPKGGVACPNCQSENVPDALFCEACGYDFTTGTMPRPWVSPFAEDDAADSTPDEPTPTPDGPAPTPVEPVETPDDRSTPYEDREGAPLEDRGETPAEPTATPAEPVPTPADPTPTPVEPTPTPVEPVETPDDLSTSLEDQKSTSLEDQKEVPDGPAPAPAEPTPSPVEPTPSPAEPTDTPDHASTSLEDPAGPPLDEPDDEPDEDPDDDTIAWVAELWVDPDWYRHQEPPDPMPSPGLPEVVLLQKRSVLVGRPSRSRGIHPDIDCDSDPGASRRQAQLTTDGRRWWVEDLDSSNGTYVAGAAEGLPARPIPVGQRRELDPDDRIYLGAWTRLVIRRATEEERETFAT